MATLPREAYLNWIHCNRCFEVYVQKRRRLFLLACHHILCEKCAPLQPAVGLNSSLAVKCTVCSKTVLYQQLSNALPPKIKELFHPHPWMEGLPSEYILRFQYKHRQQFFQYLVKIRAITGKKEQAFQLARSKAKEKLENLQRDQTERKQLEKRVRLIRGEEQKRDEERKRRQEMWRAAPSPPLSSTDESKIGTGTSTIFSRQFQVMHGQGRGAYIPPTYDFVAGYRAPDRASVSTSLLNFSSSLNRSNNSFIL